MADCVTTHIDVFAVTTLGQGFSNMLAALGRRREGGVCARAEDMLMALGLLQQRLWVGGWGEG